MASRRNDVLHSNWSFEAPTGEAMAKRLLRKGEREVASTPLELNQLAVDIENVVTDGVIMYSHLLSSRPSSSELGRQIQRLAAELRKSSPLS